MDLNERQWLVLEIFLGVLTVVSTAFALGVDVAAVALLWFAAAMAWHHRGPSPRPVELPRFEDVSVRRENEMERLREALESAWDGIVVMTGESGVGKTELVKDTIGQTSGYREIPEGGDDWETGAVNVKRIDQYRNEPLNDVLRLQRRLSEEEAGDASTRLLVILDQAERLFAPAERRKVSERLEAVCDILETCRSSDRILALVVIRRESVLDLRFFDALDEALARPFVLGGLREEGTRRDLIEAFEISLDETEGGPSREAARAIMKDCVDRNSVRAYHTGGCDALRERGDAAGTVLPRQVTPVEARVAAEGLVRAAKERGTGPGGQVDLYRRLGGLQGAIRSFFDAVIEGSPDPKVTPRVLYALSVNPRGDRALTDAQIDAVAHVDSGTRQEVIKHCQEQELIEVVEVSEDRRDWRHDFYAEHFHDYSASVLEPSDRDNIQYFRDRLDEEQVSEASGSKLWRKIAAGLFWLGSAVLWGRVLQPWWSSATQALFPLLEAHTPRIDLSFVPAAVTLTAWQGYVCAIFRRTLDRLDETGLARAFSRSLPFLSTALIFLSVWKPAMWLFWTGVGGALMGAKYLSIGATLEGDLLGRGKVFGRLGFETLGNSLLMGCLLGWGYFELFGMTLPEGWASTVYPVVTFAAMVMMLYGASVCFDSHARPGPSDRMRATFDRYRPTRDPAEARG